MGRLLAWNGSSIALVAVLLSACTPMTPTAATQPTSAQSTSAQSTSAQSPQASPAATTTPAEATVTTASPTTGRSTTEPPRLPGQDACGLTAKLVSAAVGHPMAQAPAADRPGKVHCVYLEPQGFTSVGVDLPVGATQTCDGTRWTTYASEPVNEHQYGARQGGAFVVLDGKPTITAANLRAILNALVHSYCA